MTMTELAPGEIVVDPKRLARLIADPTFRVADEQEENRRGLAEIATAATLRAHHNANVAWAMLYGGEHDKRQAARYLARA